MERLRNIFRLGIAASACLAAGGLLISGAHAQGPLGAKINVA
jgi:hypothetical protein